MTNQEIEQETKEVYKEMSEIANNQGYYLIPKSYYEKMFDLIASQKQEIEKIKKSRDSWKSKLKEIKK